MEVAEPIKDNSRNNQPGILLIISKERRTRARRGCSSRSGRPQVRKTGPTQRLADDCEAF